MTGLKKYKLPQLYIQRDASGKPNLAKGAKWYVYYCFQDPDTHKFKRFKVFDNLNQGLTIHDRKERGKEIIAVFSDLLQNLDFNPFIQCFNGHSSYRTADLIKDYHAERDGEIIENTHRNEKMNLDKLLEFSGSSNITDIDKEIIKKYLDFYYKKNKWAGSTYNKYLTQIKSFFDYVIDLKDSPIKENPAIKIKKKSGSSEANPPLSEPDLKAILKHAREHDPYFLFYYLLMYYTCFRPTREARLLQVKDIDLGQNVINVQMKNSKTGKKLGTGRTIELAQPLLDIFNEQKIFDYPPEYYVFSLSRTPGPKAVGVNFFADRWRSIKSESKVRESANLYAIKHTRVCHLVIDGEPLYRIQALTGHTTLAQLMIYLKGLKMITDKSKPLITRTL